MHCLVQELKQLEQDADNAAGVPDAALQTTGTAAKSIKPKQSDAVRPVLLLCHQDHFSADDQRCCRLRLLCLQQLRLLSQATYASAQCC